jgi:Tfp pilus assembly protein FimV
MALIVSKLSDFMPVDTIEEEIIEPAFLAAGQSTSSSPVMANHLAHQITKNPHDLRSHVQRISVFIKHKQASHTYSALVDLFLVLGENGLPLRKRMLASARNLLTDSEFTALKQSILSGLNTEAGNPAARKSLLSKGLTNAHREFIQKISVDTYEVMTPIEEAMSYIEHGQIEQAQSTLQKAIIETPHQLDLHYDLLEIYQKTGDKDQFFTSYKHLLEQAIVLPPRWREMAQSFGVEIITK